MSPSQLSASIRKKQSFLCVGLDTDPLKLPAHLLGEADPVFEFNRQIVAATAPYSVAYKLNIAFYEAQGSKGWDSLARTLEIIPEGMMVIADAKRGDIGNTSRLYARTFFETYNFDAITVAPYMGADSVAPFLEFEGKWVFLLVLTSNPGSRDFQYMHDGQEALYERVIRTAESWQQQYPATLAYVAGATRSDELARLRSRYPQAWFLVPGVGAQGGDLHAVCRKLATPRGEILINSSRGIIYASQGEDFAVQAGKMAAQLQLEMAKHF
ncbi:MAG: orotidine-5'-phosphate decarboxylase [Bacteroidetes bacterium]|nr:MAG: orotidine-5'-phosphate decarboxylase [Bacteroidota bacterium]